MTTTSVVKIPKPHIAQRRILEQASRRNVIPCGRRFGKTTLGTYRAIRPALDGYPVGWFAPSYRMLTEVWNELRFRLAPAASRTNSTERRIELYTGGLIEMWTADDPDAGRSRKYKHVIVDEAGLIRHLETLWNDAIAPTLIDLEGSADFYGTPKGRNYFWQLWQLSQSGDPRWFGITMPSSANPHLPPGEIPQSVEDALSRNIPERTYRQEYRAEFLEDGGGVIRHVRRAVADCLQDGPKPGSQYVMGVDWGKHEDFTVIFVIDSRDGSVSAYDRFNQIDYQYQLGRLRALADRFRPHQILAERNSMGEPLIEQLQRDGYPVQGFTTTNATKANIIEGLALAFERQEITIPDDQILIAELEAFESERLPSGQVRYQAPPGMHDDTVMSLALAWNAASTPQLMTAVIG